VRGHPRLEQTQQSLIHELIVVADVEAGDAGVAKVGAEPAPEQGAMGRPRKDANDRVDP
jgi:hypothetical protein